MSDYKVKLTFTMEEIREGLLPLYEFSIFDLIRSDPDIDNPTWLRMHMGIYSKLLNAVRSDMEGDQNADG